MPTDLHGLPLACGDRVTIEYTVRGAFGDRDVYLETVERNESLGCRERVLHSGGQCRKVENTPGGVADPVPGVGAGRGTPG